MSPSFSKRFVYIMFSVYLKHKVRVLYNSGLMNVFKKLRFSDRLVRALGGLTVGIKRNSRYICYLPAGSMVTEVLKMLPEAAGRGQHCQASK